MVVVFADTCFGRGGLRNELDASNAHIQLDMLITDEEGHGYRHHACFMH